VIRDEDPPGILQREIKGNPLKQWKPRDVFQAYKGSMVRASPARFPWSG
jgi:hypothetical protein